MRRALTSPGTHSYAPLIEIATQDCIFSRSSPSTALRVIVLRLPFPNKTWHPFFLFFFSLSKTYSRLEMKGIVCEKMINPSIFCHRSSFALGHRGLSWSPWGKGTSRTCKLHTEETHLEDLQEGALPWTEIGLPFSMKDPPTPKL